MMRLTCSALNGIALVLCTACFACDDDAEVRQLDSVAATEQPGGEGAGAGGAGEGTQGEQEPGGSACMPSACPAVSALGGVVPGCCQNDGSCGGLVLVMGRPLCAPPNVDNLVEIAAEGPLMQLREEPIVSDAACSERVILGTRLPGCCDQTGVCGVSSAPVATGSPGAIPGLTLPVTCVSPGEAELLGGGMAVLGGVEVEPCGPAGSLDAGAAPVLDAGGVDAGG